MKQATHEELVAAKDREDWDFLWRAAIPLVKFTIKKMMRHGEVEPHGSTEDVLQEGMLTAGAAIRSWSTYDAAFSTWISVKVRGALINYLNQQNNAGVGSRRVASGITSVSLHESRFSNEIDEGYGDELPSTSARIERLSYELDSVFPEPDSAATAEQIRAAVYAVEDLLLRDVLIRTYGFEGESASERDLAERYGVSKMMTHRWVVAAKKAVALRLRRVIPATRKALK